MLRHKTLGDETLPKTIDDLLQLPYKYKHLESGERFLLSAAKLGDGVVLVYMSDFGRRILAESKQWCMDGTFEVQ